MISLQFSDLVVYFWPRIDPKVAVLVPTLNVHTHIRKQRIA